MIQEAINTLQKVFGPTDTEVTEIIKRWNSLNDIYSRASSVSKSNRDFFLGSQWKSDDLAKKDRVHRVYNYGAQLLRKYQMYEGAKGFDVNVKYSGDDELAMLMAEAAEALIYQIIESASFYMKFMESRLSKSLYGSIYYGPIWNPENKLGGPKGTIEIRTLSPERCRVLYQDNDFEKVEAFITAKRMPVDVAKRIYGSLLPDGGNEIVPDNQVNDTTYTTAVRDYVFGANKTGIFNFDSDKLVTIWNYTDTEKYLIAVGPTKAVSRPHGYKINGKGFCPLVTEHNIYLEGMQVGISDLYFVEDQLVALNKLYSLLEEIVEDNAYPIMFEINNSLRGQKLKRGEMRGKVIPMTVGPNEEGIRQLQASVLIQPVLSAISEVKSTVFDISSMPAAAFGAYQPNTKSGFQATIQMQPALQEIDGRQVRTKSALNTLFRMCLAIIEKEDAASITIELPEERDQVSGEVKIPAQNIKLEGLSAHQIEILFGNPLPKDDARVIQNETAKQTNRFQSRRTTMQNLGVEAPTKEMKLIEDEDVKMAEIQAKVQQIMTEAQLATQAKMQKPAPGANPGGGGVDLGANGPLQPGQNPEQKFPAPSEDKSAVPSTAGEAVADTSVL